LFNLLFPIPEVDGAFIADIVGDAGHVNVGIVDLEVFRRRGVCDIGKILESLISRIVQERPFVALLKKAARDVNKAYSQDRAG
jgi:hypothetical protein